MASEAERLLEAANTRAQEIIDVSREIAAKHGAEIFGHAFIGLEVKRIIELLDTLDASMLVIGFTGTSALYDRDGQHLRKLGSACPLLVLVCQAERNLMRQALPNKQRATQSTLELHHGDLFASLSSLEQRAFGKAEHTGKQHSGERLDRVVEVHHCVVVALTHIRDLVLSVLELRLQVQEVGVSLQVRVSFG